MDIVQSIERELQQAKRQVKALGKALAAFRGASNERRPAKRRRMSAAARKRISQAQKARWAKLRAKT